MHRINISRYLALGRSGRRSTSRDLASSSKRRAINANQRTGARRALVSAFALVATAGLVVAGGAIAQDNGAGKVLVFTGTADAPNASTAAAVTALQGIGEDADLTIDVSSNAADINAANLGDYRAVAFVHSSGAVLNATQTEDLTAYVNDGGGFLGIGETANLQPGDGSVTQLIGSRPSGSSEEPSAQDVEFLDRVHPATRDLPALDEGHSDLWYTWSPNPTGSVHTVARARFGSIPTTAEFSGSGDPPAYVTEVNILDQGDSVTNDAIKGGASNTNRPVSWCRDLEHGRSFYTGMGRTAAAYGSDELVGHLEGALQWAAGTVRGNCSATINSNYQATRLTPPNGNSSNPVTGHPFIGEAVDMDIADDGRVFVAGRARCASAAPQVVNWTDPNVGLGCGTIHVWDPSGPGGDNQNPDKVDHVVTFEIFGQKGGGPEQGNNSKAEQGLTAIALDPEFTEGRPYVYVDYYPYYADDLGPGFHRPSYMGERRLARFTYDDETKSLVDGSERVIFHYMTQMYSCCHAGGSMRFDSEGNLHVPGGDYVGNSPNGANGGYANAYPNYTLPPVGAPPCTLANHNSNPDCYEGVYSFGDARISSGSTATYDGAMYRIRPVPNPPAAAAKLAPSGPGTGNAAAPWASFGPGQATVAEGPTQWGLGTHYTLPDADSPNGANMFALTSPEVVAGLAKPEIYSMGLRNQYSIEIDPETDLIGTASVGPDQGSHNNTWGLEGHSAHTLLPEAGNYLGWPFCWGNGIGYRKKLPGSGSGVASPVGTPGTIPGPPASDGAATGGWIDCRNPILNDSPFNEGIETVPAPKPVNFWWGRSNLGCPDYRRDQNLLPFNFVNAERFHRCPWAAKNPTGGGQAGMAGPFYRVPDGAESPWPEYWDGRWFLFNYSSANTTRHAVLLPDDPDNTSEAIASDSLVNIVTTSQLNMNSVLGHQFGPDGSLYMLNYGQGFFVLNNTTALWRFSYTGGDDTPGPEIEYETTGDPGEVDFSIGRSGGVSYEWDFGDGNTSDETHPTHAFDASHPEVELTVTYADGEEATRTVEVDVIGALAPTNTDAPELMGTGAPGAMLTCERGEWTGNGSYSYEWTLDGEPVEVGTDEGQTGSTNPTRYRADADDAGSDVVCHVTRTSPGYGASAPAASNAVELGAGPAGPENTVAPTLTGSGNIGTMLTCNRGEWTGSGAYSYSWTVDGDPVAVGTGAGQTGSTNPARFRAMAEYSGDQVVCHVTRNGSAPASSNAVTIGS